MTIRSLGNFLLLIWSCLELPIVRLVKLLRRSLLSELRISIEWLSIRLRIILLLSCKLVNINCHIHAIEHVRLAWHWLELGSSLELVIHIHWCLPSRHESWI